MSRSSSRSVRTWRFMSTTPVTASRATSAPATMRPPTRKRSGARSHGLPSMWGDGADNRYERPAALKLVGNWGTHMLLKPKCPVIAIEEHYWDAELASHFTGTEAGRPGETQRRLDDLGALRIKEMD